MALAETTFRFHISTAPPGCSCKSGTGLPTVIADNNELEYDVKILRTV
jgi:hypothetical protein